MALELTGMRVHTLSMARRALRDIRRDNFRQVRKYVDLCALLSKGTGHKLFFERAQHILEKTDSLYYPLIQRCIESVDETVACTFGVNLGIDAMTFGARKMQLRAAAGQPLAPWLTVARAAEPGLDILMQHREEKGQFFWVLHTCSEAERSRALLLADRHPKCAIALLSRPEQVTPALVEELLRHPNVMLVLQMEQPEIDEALCAATTLLQRGKLFYGVTLALDDESAAQILETEWQSLLAQHSLCCVYTTSRMSSDAAAALTETVWKQRMATGALCLPLLWEADSSYISERIAPGAWVEHRSAVL